MVESTNFDQMESDEDKTLKDAHIFDPTKNVEEELNYEFQVRDPCQVSGTTLYKITGRDKEGLFEG
jgi:hypothetical protein